MINIKSLISNLAIQGRTKEQQAFEALNDGIFELISRINKLELPNLKYFCTAYRGADQLLNPGTTVIALTHTEYPQFGNMHDNTNDNNYIFIKRSGVYHLSAGAQFAANATGTFRQVSIRILRGGATIVLVSNRAAVNAAILTINASRDYYLYADDRVEMSVTHDAAVAINVTANNPQSPFLTVTERMEDLPPSELGLLNPSENTR